VPFPGSRAGPQGRVQPSSANPPDVPSAPNGKTSYPIANCHIIYGKGEDFAAWTIDGGRCTIGATRSYPWSGVPDPSTYKSRFLRWLIVGDDGTTMEGSWGLTFPGGAEESGESACKVRTITTKNTSASCGTP
jgi:hypothetical protein